jgi:O-antigen ligase
VKYIALVALLASVLPLASWLRRNPNAIPKVCVLIGILPYDFVHAYMAILGFPSWPGHVAGAEFSVLDGLALSIYIATPSNRKPLPFRISMALYFLATLASVFQATVPMAALFYVWQLPRMVLVYAAITKACADPRVPFAIIKGMAIGLIAEAGTVIFQRFALGMLQAPGSFSAQNFLGLTSHFAVFPIFALLLAQRQGRLIQVAAVAGVIVELFTTSRATIALAAMGYALIFAMSALRRWTSRKARIAIIAVLAIMVATPVVISSFQDRFTKEREYLYDNAGDIEKDERFLFQKAASMILDDHPWGVGPNHYVLAANQPRLDGSPSPNVQAGIPLSENNLLAHVHNVYWLIADESGYVGLIAFVILLLQPLTLAFRCGWRNRGDIRGDLLLGIGVSLLIVYLHSFAEWVFVCFQCQYMFALHCALVVGLSRQLGWRAPVNKLRDLYVGSDQTKSRFKGSYANRTAIGRD